MKTFFCVGVTALVISLTCAVCQETAAQYPRAGQAAQGYAQPYPSNGPSPQGLAAAQNEKAARIRANLAKLPEEDRQLAEAQGFCPIMVKNRLGVMGPPIKVMIKDQPVFVCCAGCRKKALANPDRTLAIVAQLQAKVAEAEISASLAKLSPEDRQLAEAQGYCPVMTDNRLGVMGPPVKLVIGTQPVFLCCAGCRTRALANPDRTLAVVAQLQARVSEAAARKAMIEQQRTR
jgi:hypothetical protein